MLSCKNKNIVVDQSYLRSLSIDALHRMPLSYLAGTVLNIGCMLLRACFDVCTDRAGHARRTPGLMHVYIYV